MGRNKPRSRAVDVTRSLLQPTSITDRIPVQVAPNHVVQIAEEDLSPTQGSEAAFALRREGKLDASMKLCVSWRKGGCPNHAACSFAHVTQYFGVSAELAAGGSGSVGTPGTPGHNGLTGSATFHAASTQKTAPVSGGGGGGVAASSSRDDEKAKASASTGTPAPAVGVASSAGTGPAASAAPPVSPATAADAAATGHGAPSTAAEDAASDSDAASTPAAVVSSEGLRAVLASLSVALAGKATAAAAVSAPSSAPAEAPAGSTENSDTDGEHWPHLDWLQHTARRAEEKERASGAASGTFSWQAPVWSSFDDIITAAGTEMLGESLSTTDSALTIYQSFVEHVAPAARRQTGPPQRRAAQATDSAGRPAARTADPRQFSTAPTADGFAALVEAMYRMNARGGRQPMRGNAFEAGGGYDVDEAESDFRTYGLPHR